jgi:glycosyltransferase involved in cell wall biosynthesis
VSNPYDIVFAVNYYAPYVSGLTEVVRIVAEALAKEGANVLVVAGRHDRALPLRDRVVGVDVIRTPVAWRVGKGLISPAFVPTVIRYGRRAGVVNLHTPMIESGPIALGLGRTPLVTTYQCDIALPSGLVNKLQMAVMDASNSLAMRRSDVIVPSSTDYAVHSRLAGSMPERRILPIAPPTSTHAAVAPTFRETNGLHVGFLGRLVEEKGLEYLVDGFRALEDPEARLLIAGDYAKVAGGSTVEKVRRHMGDDSRIRLLGFLPDDALPHFYSSLDVFALPSVNSFEAFGIVQVEAMKAGVAALASDLPGVRTPVQNTGFGRIVPPRDPSAITATLVDLRDSPLDRVAGAVAANALYSVEQTVEEYRLAFEKARAAKVA